MPGASEAAIRNLPPSAVGDPSNLDAMSLLASNKGRPMEAIVEQVRDGSSLRVFLLPDFQFVQVFVAGIQVESEIDLNDFLIGFIYKSKFTFYLFIYYRHRPWEEGLFTTLFLNLKRPP